MIGVYAPPSYLLRVRIYQSYTCMLACGEQLTGEASSLINHLTLKGLFVSFYR